VILRPGSAAALAAAGLLVLAGCGEKRETTTGAASPAGGAGVTVSESEFKLTPANAQAAKGGEISIQLKNDGGTQHALEIKTPGGEVKSKTLSPGDSQTLTANLKPGTYEMYCPIDGHKAQGMAGTISVGAAPGGGTTTNPEGETTTSSSPGY
jgi:uncharacterized cupredoxin-like copper-binding protein